MSIRLPPRGISHLEPYASFATHHHPRAAVLTSLYVHERAEVHPGRQGGLYIPG